jgi:PhnB protein
MTKLNPYLSFKAQAREALEFYRSVLGGELDLSTFGSLPEMGVDPAEQDLIMHGQLDTPSGLTLMAADSGSMMPHVAPTSGMSVALTGNGPEDLEYVRGAVAKLSDGATDTMPFEMAPWGSYYGQLTDKFGISWMFNVGVE